jgi:hypothetical protein
MKLTPRYRLDLLRLKRYYHRYPRLRPLCRLALHRRPMNFERRRRLGVQ